MSNASDTTHNFSKESSVIRDKKGRTVVMKAYCHNGHYLMSEEHKYEGYPAIKLLSLHEGKESEILLSPILNDNRKVCPVYPHMTVLEILCPVCREPLQLLAPCGCAAGSNYRTIFLRNDPDIHWSIGICDAYGCPNSFIRDGEDIITEAREAQSTVWA